MVIDLREDAQGSDIGYVAITQDITERLQAERERCILSRSRPLTPRQNRTATIRVPGRGEQPPDRFPGF